jgi:hypothetical protein
MGSNPTRGMDISAFILFVLSFVGSSFAADWFPAQGILPTVYMIKKL